MLLLVPSGALARVMDRGDLAIDVSWLIDTTSILGAAEAYLLITRLTGARRRTSVTA